MERILERKIKEDFIKQLEKEVDNFNSLYKITNSFSKNFEEGIYKQKYIMVAETYDYSAKRIKIIIEKLKIDIENLGC